MRTDALDGCTALVTGANSGVGLETARNLARMGARVVLGVRRVEKGEEARKDIIGTTGNPAVELMRLDLASLREVKHFGHSFRAKHPRLDILVNNAGIHTGTPEMTQDDVELTFQTNHLGHFLLTRELLPVLKASAPSRIVTVASEAHRIGRMHFDDINLQRRWSGIAAYAQSKLANILFSNALARRLDGSGVTSNAVHPGSVRSNWARGEDSGPFRWLVKATSPFHISPEKGARTPTWAATAPELEGVTGRYFMRRREARPTRAARDVANQERLWTLSEALLERAGV